MIGNKDTRRIMTEAYLGQGSREAWKYPGAVEALAAANDDPYGFWATQSEDEKEIDMIDRDYYAVSINCKIERGAGLKKTLKGLYGADVFINGVPMFRALILANIIVWFVLHQGREERKRK